MGHADNSAKLLGEVQAFQAQEIRLLQNGRLDEWLELFTEDVRYWMPVVHVREGDHTANDEELAHFDESHYTLALRVKRAKSRVAWTEHPPSRVRYLVQPIAVESREDGELEVESNFIVYQTRLQNEENFFVGTRHDKLRRVGEAWRISGRKIVVDRAVLPSKNVTVFF